VELVRHPQSLSGQLRSTGTILATPPGYPNGTAETRDLWRRDAVFPPFGGDGDRIIAHASANSDKRVVRPDTGLSPPVDPSRGGSKRAAPARHPRRTLRPAVA